MPRIWLITGCDSGMGYRIAETALENGDRVAATVLSKELQGPLKERFPDRCRYYHLDIRDSKMVSEVVSRIHGDFGSIDVLVNNAGYGLLGSLEETSEDEYRRLFDVNVFGLAEITKAVLPIMRKQRSGRIINTASQAGFVGVMGLAFYSASKFAVEGLSEALAREVAPFGIHVSIIEPGSFRTEFAGNSLALSAKVIEDYASTAGVIRAGLTGKHGKQPNDPGKLGKVVWKLSTAEKPPMHLAIGEDCLLEILGKLDAVRAQAEEWRDVSCSTYFDEIKASA